MTVHEAPVSQTVEWYTPPEFFDKMGVNFDLDPAMPEKGADWVPADTYTRRPADGLKQPWRGRVWLNPPYGPSLPSFVDRMIEHRYGLMLVPSRTETDWFQRAATRAWYVNFLADRIHFIRDDGVQARASFGSALMAYGYDDDIRAAIFAFDGWIVDNDL